jgi:hypothetical protein
MSRPHTPLDGDFVSLSSISNSSDSIRVSENINPSIAESREPVAVVGFAFQLPGEAADTPESFWKVLLDRQCTATEFPQDRLNFGGLYHPDKNRRGTACAP